LHIQKWKTKYCGDFQNLVDAKVQGAHHKKTDTPNKIKWCVLLEEREEEEEDYCV